jgi:hypothetical protein
VLYYLFVTVIFVLINRQLFRFLNRAPNPETKERVVLSFLVFFFWTGLLAQKIGERYKNVFAEAFKFHIQLFWIVLFLVMISESLFGK